MFRSFDETNQSTKTDIIAPVGREKDDRTAQPPTSVPRNNISSKLQTPTPPISQQSFISATSGNSKIDSPPIFSRHERKEHVFTDSQSAANENLQGNTHTTDENKSSDTSAFTVLQTQEQSKPKKTPPTSQQSLNSTSSSSKFNSPPILKHSHKKLKQTFLDKEDGKEENKESLCDTEEQYESTESLLPMASILNVVVDYYMSEPTPLEPEEFQWKLMMRQQRLKQKLNLSQSKGLEDEDGGMIQSPEDIKDDPWLSQKDTIMQQEIQVPVLRIFGPIARGMRIPSVDSKPEQPVENVMNHDEDASEREVENKKNFEDKGKKTPSTKKPYLQSACLHIHEAYPYLMARPIAAGPDGSSMFFRQSKPPCKGDYDVGRTQIDWDDADSVSLILEDVHSQLESMLVSSIEQSSPQKQKDNDIVANSVLCSMPLRFIRKLSIVEGRGFYTYCNGTTAPFIRVEYYNPSHRWRVKILLERGLEMPLESHPKTKNDTAADDDCGEGEDDSFSMLKFRCYEAHIPYTMQFFKDWNLSGMSWIKIGDGRFRTPIPRTAKKKLTSQNLQKNRSKCDTEKVIYQHLLTRRNIPPALVWNARKGTCAMKLPQEVVNVDLDQIIGDEFWTKKETSCDVEIDTNVANILNVSDVMKQLPSDPKENQKGIHWRAVPSLKEIWTEERERMAYLVPSKKDILTEESLGQSSQKPHQFTLSVKKGAPLPGSYLAIKGVRNLYRSSPDIYSNYHRVMKEIVNRHEHAIHRFDREFKEVYERKQYNNELTSSRRDITSPLVIEERGENKEEDAIMALKSLIDQFAPDNLTPKKAKMASEENMKSQSMFSTPVCSQQMSQWLTQSIAQSQSKFSQTDLEEIEGDIEFGMQSEVINGCTFSKDGSHSNKSSLIAKLNPATLTPYDDDTDEDDDVLKQEEEMEEEDFEMILSVLETQSFTHRDQEHIIKKTEEVIQNHPQESMESKELKRDSERADMRPLDVIGNVSARSALLQHSLQDFSSERKESHHHLEYQLKPSRQLSHQSTLSLSSIRKNSSLEPIERAPFRGVFEESLWQATTEITFGFQNMPLSSQHVEACEVATNSFLEPVARAPLTQNVFSWISKSRSAKCVTKGMKRRRLMDDNSRKLVVQSSQKKKCVAMPEGMKLSSCLTCGVEEVECSTASTESHSQHSSTSSSAPSFALQTAITIDSIGTRDMENSKSPAVMDPLEGIGQQGGKIHVAGGGLKATTKVSPFELAMNRVPQPQLTIMSIEVHVQCRIGKAGLNDSREIAMRPDSSRDKVFAVTYVYAFDPGGGESIEIIERGCICVPLENELSDSDEGKAYKNVAKTMGISSLLNIEVTPNERTLLLRIASIVQWKDPDVLLSWDTQGGGLGYLIERGLLLEQSEQQQIEIPIDMIRLLGRNPRSKAPGGVNEENMDFFHAESRKKVNISGQESGSRKDRRAKDAFEGSILGAEWDERVGAGAGPSSIKGRLVLNGWKIISDEVHHANTSYQQAMVFTILGKRIPFHDDLLLTRWYSIDKGKHRWRVISHKLAQTLATILLFDALDVIGRAGEAARLSGVELSQSFPGIRGSQYKVEGVLLRALQSLWSDERGEKMGKTTGGQTLTGSSKSTISQSQSPWKLRRNMKRKSGLNEEGSDRGYFFFSPSKADATLQEALECQAMTLEPKSGFYFDPVVVCDFTALYPSLIIAYNLCYSTCAGKLDYQSTRPEMKRSGCTTGSLGPFDYDEIQTANALKQHMKSLTNDDKINGSRDRAYCLPTGSIFVSEDVLKGVLPNVLSELLATRAMLKKAAKEYKKLSKPPAAVLRQLEARQLALKYVANVTYGYTSATFSGRSAMPLLADAIVDCGRRTLSNAISLANTWGRDRDGPWFGAEVIYGDTDSLFVKLPGRTVKEAFSFGNEFCKEVTASNPPPIQLKLEKVYGASLMQTKKKYCGMKYESLDQIKPTFEAKGLETVRRDQCALTQKILRNALITIFRDGGIRNLKSFLQRQWALIHAGRLPVSDYILTGRVRSQYRGGKIGPVQAALARRLAEADPGRTVRHKERVPYVIVGSPGRTYKLRDCVLTPNELLSQWDSFTIHAAYYATKHVNAALQRCLGLSPYKINVHAWYEACPKPQKRIHYWPLTRTGGSAMISAYFGSDTCAMCKKKCKVDGGSKAVICNRCKKDRGVAVYLAMNTLNSVQQHSDALASICQRCNGCLESSGTYASEKCSSVKRNCSSTCISRGGIESPISNCTCTDCPTNYKRHAMREAEIEALALCKALKIFE